jgi:23S rRNA pseudouridine1911/1915/1917 synthase
MSNQFIQRAMVSAAHSGKRFDQVAAVLFADFSRSRLKSWILSGELRVNGDQRQPRDKVWERDQLSLAATLVEEGDWQPEAIDLDIVYEDAALLVVNKPAGLVVHPAAGHRDGTLLNALLHHCPELVELPRAGIVHRLDKDTTGLMVVAKQLPSHTSLVAQLQARSVKRQYRAVVVGTPVSGGTVDAPMGRHPHQRKKMAVVKGQGKEAITHFRILQRFAAHTELQLNLETGRTHQIRVHMASIGLPLVGDPAYGGRMRLPKGASEELQQGLRGFSRQALHAAELGLLHPATGEPMSWQAPLPDDMQQLLALLQHADNANR